MLMVVPSGNTKLDTPFDTPRFSRAHFIETGSVPALDVVVKATTCASTIPRKYCTGLSFAINKISAL